MEKKFPKFPEDFKPDKDSFLDDKKINGMINTLLDDNGSPGLTSIQYDPPYIVINRDPCKNQDYGKIVVILQVVMTADYSYG